jgi:CheY-like chemotaxis protein
LTADDYRRDDFFNDSFNSFILPFLDSAPVSSPRSLYTSSASGSQAPFRLHSFAMTTDDSQPGDDSANIPDAQGKKSETSGQKKILLVDDDPEIIDTVSYALETAGYCVLIARDGNQGLALAQREDPALMILDMMMPKRSGFLVLEKLRRIRDTPLPVIMITGNEGSRHKSYAELLGVSDYLRKPFPMERLLAAVEKLLA